MKTLALRTLQLGGAVLLLGTIAYAGKTILEESAVPCAEPLTYYVAGIDERFAISEAELEEVLDDAAALWNTAAGKPVLTRAEGGALPIRLVYDERQATANLGEIISTEQATYDAQKVKVDALIAAHEADEVAYNTRARAFETREAAYEAEVAKWNAQGGAPPQKYRELEERRRALEREQGQLAVQSAKLNSNVENINSAVAELNAFAAQVNTKVNVFNEFAGKDFDQGQYVEDAEGKRITIYEFGDKTQLTRALAHEFGHALGILHTEDPKSLMYPYNSGKTLSLAEEDITALKAVCEL